MAIDLNAPCEFTVYFKEYSGSHGRPKFATEGEARKFVSDNKTRWTFYALWADQEVDGQSETQKLEGSDD